jgi:hypothetical protein
MELHCPHPGLSSELANHRLVNSSFLEEQLEHSVAEEVPQHVESVASVSDPRGSA